MVPLEDWPNVKRVLEGALLRTDAELPAYLEDSCGRDALLRAQVEHLLAVRDRAGTFLEKPAAMLLDATATREDLSGRVIGAYHVVSRLGGGGMGEVYLGHDSRLDRRVAIKFLSPELAVDRSRLRRFHQEAKAASSVNHPHIVVVHDFGEWDGRPYLVTEFIEGETLRHRLRQGPLPIRDVLDLGVQMASALAAAHAQDIVHRDVKPENVMVRPDGFVKVVDFGLAKLSTREAGAHQVERDLHTRTGTVMGTPCYMSPEQARGLALDARSDVWSLGVVLYEMATGRLPFAERGTATGPGGDRDDGATDERTRRDPPAELLAIICTALETVRDRRYQNAGDLCTALKRLHSPAPAISAAPERSRAANSVSNDPVAYHAYLKGRYYWNMVGDIGVAQAVAQLERATQFDPSYALAYAGLARAHVLQAEYYVGVPRRALEAARTAAARAVELDPILFEAHLAVGEVRRLLDWDWSGAEAAYLRAIALQPRHDEPHRVYALLLASQLRFEEAIRESECARELEPLCAAVNSSAAAWVRFLAGDYDTAITLSRESAEMEPRYVAARRVLAAAYLQAGRGSEAVATLEEALNALGGDPMVIAALAHAAAVMGNRNRAVALLDGLHDAAGPRRPSSYDLGLVYAGLGDVNAAFAALDRAVDDADPALIYLAADPRLQPLGSDSRYPILRGRLGLREPSAHPSRLAARPARDQHIRFCTTADGQRIAYSVIGAGPVVVRVLGHFTHLEIEWEWPDLRRFWDELAARHTVVRYDGRGIGLSDPYIGDFTEETRQLDLEAVLGAVGAENAALLGISEGGWTAAACAVGHPHRITHLILYGAYCRGAQARPGFDPEEDSALITLIRKGWGRDTPAFRQVFTSRFFRTDADPGLIAHFNHLQRVSADPDTAARYYESCHRRGDGQELYRQLTTPTLVLHSRDDLAVSAEEGWLLASIIPGAQLVLLPSGTHYFPTDTEVVTRATRAIERFLQTAG